MNENLHLGEVITTEQQKDAIHIAVAPVVASQRLAPGQHIGFIGELVGPSKQPIGIVDPFLSGPVFKGDKFWMFLYPGTISSLRHDWTHPAFTARGTSEEWLRRFAEDRADLSYQELMDGAEAYLKHGDYLIDGGKWEGFDVPDEFWDHYEIVKQVAVPEDQRGSFFSCSC